MRKIAALSYRVISKLGGLNLHPEQDPAEGSRKSVEHDLKRQDGKRNERADPDASPPKLELGSEAAELSPE